MDIKTAVHWYALFSLKDDFMSIYIPSFSPKKIRKWRSVQLNGDSGEERVIQNGTDSNDWLNNRRAARSTSFHDWRDSYKNNSFNNPSPNNNGVPPAQFRNQREVS